MMIERDSVLFILLLSLIYSLCIIHRTIRPIVLMLANPLLQVTQIAKYPRKWMRLCRI